MFSTIVFVPLAGISYWMSRRANNNKKQLESASEISNPGQGNICYASFFPYTNNPLLGNNMNCLSFQESIYDVYQEMFTSKYGSSTATSEEHRQTSAVSYASDIFPEYAASLLPKLHNKFADNFENYVSDNKPPPTLFAHDINITQDVSLTFKNRPHIGVRHRYKALLADNTTDYLVVGRYNGRQFYDILWLEKNKTIETLVQEQKESASMYKWTAFGICAIGVAAAVGEAFWNRAQNAVRC